jgi:hypothetical protein
MADTKTKQTWARILDKLALNLADSKANNLAEDARRVAVFTQLAEVGWKNVSELDCNLDRVILTVGEDDSQDPDPHLALRIPAKFPVDAVSIEAGGRFDIHKG